MLAASPISVDRQPLGVGSHLGAGRAEFACDSSLQLANSLWKRSPRPSRSSSSRGYGASFFAAAEVSAAC